VDAFTAESGVVFLARPLLSPHKIPKWQYLCFCRPRLSRATSCGTLFAAFKTEGKHFGRIAMVRKLFLMAVPVLFLGCAAMAEDIVYESDWRAGETGFIHHDCDWHHHHRTVSGVTYSDANGVAYDTEYAPDNTAYGAGYAPDYNAPDYGYDVRYDRDRQWREGRRDWREGRRDFNRDRAFRDERFRDRGAAAGAGVQVGGRDGVGAGARVDESGAGAGAQVGGPNGVGAGASAGPDSGVGAGVNAGGHGVGVGVGGDTGVDIHAK
jgi:hypothetical protein